MPNDPLPPQLTQLARAYGVATEYWDWQGAHVTVSAETIHAVLGALGVQTDDADAVSRALNAVDERPWRRMLAPVQVSTLGTEITVAVHVPHGSPVTVWLELEEWGGKRMLKQIDKWVDPRLIDGSLVGEATFEVPADVPTGWHTLFAQIPDEEPATGRLVVVPSRLQLPPTVQRHGASGLMNQLYSVRSERSWGIGDFADLAELGAWSARGLGCDFMLINPVHAAEPTPPMEPSPYLPTSRRFVNPIYLRVEDISEVAYLDAEDRARIEALAAAARRANDSDRLDRDACWALKEQALRLLFAQPRPPRRQNAFEAFCEREGVGLLDFATWCAFTRAYGQNEWPEGLQDPRSQATEAAREEHADEVMFTMWLQWLLDTQLATAQREMVEAGMSLGVVQDLAVGVHPAGADAWSLAEAFAQNVTVGAPPDPYNQRGQDWSQPPWRPDRLEELAYAPFRDMIRAAMRHSGGLRIDHIIGLFRLWWVPAGRSPLEGTYVRYDHDALIGILMLEAERAGAVVIGEDLGTVEPWVRTYLAKRGILGTSILWFEKGEDGRPLPPESYRTLCLASVTTHDLPPTAGYLTGEHMAIREELDLFTRPIEIERAEDEAEREKMMGALRERGLLSQGEPLDGEEGLRATVEGLHRYLSWSPAALLGIAVPDLVGDRRAMNQPGTSDEYPNWRLSLADPDRRPLKLQDVIDSRPGRRLAACVNRGTHGN
ncbi:4-alpha-glucanotransferase [Gephyromycinifex aptenodytis]|uniref:4-alpha-glucanotransferase n=1 Tax=Gephyromycinifex aptenodytis TaxID=2716227 RepID=UPI001447E153|nr:4-alpha-glucanotransferase [Gephyromycinifex aptenodytis]